MKTNQKILTTASQFRKDPVSGEWIIIATGRAKRPQAFLQEKRERYEQPIEECPFENPQRSGNPSPLLEYSKDGAWFLQVISNKYPALSEPPSQYLACPEETKRVPYSIMEGVGFHEVIITRDHRRQIAKFTLPEAELVLKAYQERYLALHNKECVEYILIFHNHGREAGASLSHPHSQLIALPIIPPDAWNSLEGSKAFYETHQKCVHCAMIEQEKEDKTRIIFENELSIAFCPFVSQTAFEIRVYPKSHQACFESINDKERLAMAEALKASLYKIFQKLNDPDYNFFIHTTPCEVKEEYHLYYHWHIEILPKTAVLAGFELGTNIKISTIEPEKAANFLKKGLRR